MLIFLFSVSPVENSTQESSCLEVPEIFLWSTITRQFEPYQTINEGVIDSDQAPVLKSTALLRRSLNKNYQNNNDDKTVRVLDVKTFKNPQNLERYVISSIQEGSNDYVDIMKQQSASTNTNVGSL